ncbi:MAG: exodeoxyribonuclease VII small subunit [Coriobacteriaceae bacterium]|jgi:exodeoxyribonuclease VII small subunit|nr:exodeoxyribonuclease VII small subunit [Coriobacteriaceae bacterium]
MTDEPRVNFEAVNARLTEIVDAVSVKDISLDEALDLYEEAVKLGMQVSNLLEEDISPHAVQEALEDEAGQEAGEEADAQGAGREATEALEGEEGRDVPEASAQGKDQEVASAQGEVQEAPTREYAPDALRDKLDE